MKTYRGSEGIAPSFLTTVPDGCDWSTTRHGRFIHGGKSTRYPLQRRLCRHKCRFRIYGGKKNLALAVIEPHTQTIRTEGSAVFSNPSKKISECINLKFSPFFNSASTIRPPLWSSGQSSWLQILRSGFDSRRYQIFWERGPTQPREDNWGATWMEK
jgi:hypothetical protein